MAHVFGRWRSEAERPPSYLAGQEPVPEVFPEGLQWLLRRGTFVERWEVSLTVDRFRWQLSQQDHSPCCGPSTPQTRMRRYKRTRHGNLRSKKS